MQTGSDFSLTGVVMVTGFVRGFMPCPIRLVDGFTEEQIQWQQQIYQRAYMAALESLSNTKPFRREQRPDARN